MDNFLWRVLLLWERREERGIASNFKNALEKHFECSLIEGYNGNKMEEFVEEGYYY